MAYRILLIGGGSGGHVFPLVAVGRALREAILERAQDVELVMLGEGHFFKEAAQREAAQTIGFKYHSIIAGKLRRYFSFRSIIDFLKMPVSFFQSMWHLFWIMPDAVFTKSGYASFFPVLWAKMFFIPIYLHDSDAVPGVASRVMSRWAKKIFISFESAAQYFPAKKVILSGNPVREGILNSNRDEALVFFKFSPALPTVLISGGSQGAKNINDIVLQSIVQLTSNFQVIHQCGKDNFAQVNATVEQLIKEGQGKYGDQIAARYRVYPFFSDRELSLAYALSDVIVARSGSGSLFEIAALGKPGVVIPLKNSASDHQYYNALEFSKHGGIMIEEDNLVTSVFVDQIRVALERKEELGQAVKGFSRPNAAKEIAEEILRGI
ncbi:MAG: UDP-N-acetylglucosamine--N-acetylmuramyl-(pentapeptide) pyrophosphoryl-undecaprenol N-acetylglucosamine transferase [bacterium]|nr:UDP-N-acetylglucosamine--N-acetylmuramyl-(pentapeptide) pyrophosphoryl-undecaprenol N-acetylglucosamine transferase [bacterium]